MSTTSGVRRARWYDGSMGWIGSMFSSIDVQSMELSMESAARHRRPVELGDADVAVAPAEREHEFGLPRDNTGCARSACLAAASVDRVRARDRRATPAAT